MERPTVVLDQSHVGKTVKEARRVLSYLLRAMKKRVDASAIGRERFRGLSSELSNSLVPLVVSEKSTLAFGKALANRFGIDLTGGDTEWGPVEAWLPEGRIRWDRALAALDYRHVRLVVHENPAFLATFACDRECEGEDSIFASFPEPVGDGAYRATLPRGLIQPRNHATVWTLTSPMAHGADEKSGNVNLFRRHRVVNPLTGEQSFVPFMSGNAVRGVWRDMVMARFCELVGVSPKALPSSRVHALFSGGGVEKGADGASVNLRVRDQAREMCPAWDLFAGCTDQQIMQGRIRVHDAVLVCAENDWLVFPHLNPGVEMTAEALATFSDSLPEAAELTQLRLGTRHAHKDYAGSEGAQMIFNTEVVLGGAQFVHSFQIYGIDGVSPITAACLADLVTNFRDWGVVGASNARGLGLIAFDAYQPGPGTPTLPDPSIYLAHVDRNKDAMREWLMRVGDESPPKAERPAKGTRTRQLPPTLKEPSSDVG
jgi:hypothetical protein